MTTIRVNTGDDLVRAKLFDVPGVANVIHKVNVRDDTDRLTIVLEDGSSVHIEGPRLHLSLSGTKTRK